ncbi:glycosyltransferase [Phytohalomonas tamaricis]|uniref:glycosyltransferase n=1 Tax=Phytohalomonas tamaricis TaxID=2081032 RepID=UPI00131A411D|nr:glycosyltransferase [Phytohalomonas tamaricis]
MKTLWQLYEFHEGKVSDKWSLYLNEYDRLLSPYRQEDINLLEIGVQNGGSLEIWASYFSKANHLVGCDINPVCSKLEYKDPRVTVFIGDAGTVTTLEKITKLCSRFDVIIDDGSHTSSSIISSFMHYFNILNDDGVYIVEDLHCSYWQDYEGGLYAPCSSVSFFKQLIDIVNCDHWGVESRQSDIITSFEKIYGISFDNFPLKNIHSIEFIDSLCVIKKRKAEKNCLGRRIIVGEEAIVESSNLPLKGLHAEAPDQNNNYWSSCEHPVIELEKLKGTMQKQQKDIEEQNDIILKQRQLISDYQAKLEYQQKELSEQRHELAIKVDESESHHKNIESLNQQLAEHRQSLSVANATLDSLINSESWKITAPARFISRQVKEHHLIQFLKRSVQMGGGLGPTFKRAYKLYRTEGLNGIRRGIYAVKSGSIILPAAGSGEVDRNDYAEWIRRYDTIDENKRINIKQTISAWESLPLISVVMPTYNPNPEWLAEAIESVQKQLYPNWELCIADDASTDSNVRKVLDEYSKEDQRIKVAYRKQNGHISESSNTALEIVTGDWVALLDHDDILPEHALFHVARTIISNPDVKLIYSDEDKIDENGERKIPYFKCDWNRDLFYSHNMISHLGVYYKPIVDEIGGFRKGFEGAQDYDLALRFIEKIKTEQIHHIPHVLYHWRVHSGSTSGTTEAKPYAVDAGERALNEHFSRQNIAGRVEHINIGYRAHYDLPDPLPLVSLIIPTRNALNFVKQCVESITKKTTYSNYEIIIIDNNSDDPDALAFFAKLAKKERIRVIRDERPFNYSALNNAAVEEAAGEFIGLINNDIEVISPDWLSEMVSLACQPQVGAVGARLLYPNNTVQHAGVVVGMGGVACHAHKDFPDFHSGYFGRAKVINSFSAVTAACLVVSKKAFKEVGGLNETELKIAFNDVDFCLKLLEAGYRNVWTPYAELYHHESVSRGYEDTPEKQARFNSEIDYMKSRWGTDHYVDPAYSLNLTLNKEDFSLSWPPRV